MRLVTHSLRIIGRNVLGWSLVIAGVLLALPFVPGPGTPIVLFGLALADWPYKRKVFCWLRQQSWFSASEAWLEKKFKVTLPVAKEPTSGLD